MSAPASARTQREAPRATAGLSPSTGARYDNLVADGWTVLRFAWEQVIHRPDRVRTL